MMAGRPRVSFLSNGPRAARATRATMNADLAISPCPNDTYIFYHLIHDADLFAGWPGAEGGLAVALEDVEELNRRALEEGRHAVTKLSYYALSALEDRYQLLEPGGALGEGCGPLLISGRDPGAGSTHSVAEVLAGRPRILVPGRWTTAFLLLQLYLRAAGLAPDAVEFVPTRYDRIMPALASGAEQFGIIIHEDRFTFRARGLFAVQDLGAWWEETTGLPIPLGGIAVRRDLGADFARRAAETVRESLLRARRDVAPAWPYIKEHAQALEDEVIRQHIELYVNDYSLDPGERGRQAIRTLFERARAAGLA